MKVSEPFFEALFFVVLFQLLGAMVAEQWFIVIYYYGEHISDPIILGGIVFLSCFAGRRFIPSGSYLSYLFLFLLLSFSLLGEALGYHLHRHTDWASLIIYGGLAVSGIAVSCFSQKLTSKNALVLSVAAFLVGFTIIHFGSFGSVYILFPALIILIVQSITFRRHIVAATSMMGLAFSALFFLLDPVPVQYFESQNKYYDPVIYSRETAFQKVDITRWKGQNWFYYNNVNQFSSIDHWMYFEPMVHPLMHLKGEKNRILVVGGENGMVTRELLKYPEVGVVEHVPIDTTLYHLASSNRHFTELNKMVLRDKKAKLNSTSPFDFLYRNEGRFNLIFIDIPDPLDLELNQYYTHEFYELCHAALTDNGMLITQAGSPYYASKAFYCIQRTMEKAGFSTVAMHNQILTLGEWGWIIGAKHVTAEELKARLVNIDFPFPETQWLNQDAMKMMLSFGKSLTQPDTAINSLKNPIVHQYYTTGTWKF